jgi:hypothetical protein
MKGQRDRETYLRERAKLHPPEVWEKTDAWPLYAGRQNIQRYIYLYALLQRIEPVPGDIAEFGVWKGATTAFMAKMLAWTPRVVHAFDNFEGFSKEVVDEKALRSGYRGSRAELEAMLEVDGLLDAVVIHEGDIVKQVDGLDTPARLAFALMDCDVYEPTIAALHWVHERLSVGGIIAFDEYNDPAWPGETEAAQEFLEEHGDVYTNEASPVAQPSLVLVRRLS